MIYKHDTVVPMFVNCVMAIWRYKCYVKIQKHQNRKW